MVIPPMKSYTEQERKELFREAFADIGQLAHEEIAILAPEMPLNDEINKNTYLTIGRGEKVDSR